MSEIIKIKALCIKKLDYRDTSKIVTLYSAEYGKFSALIKAGRSNKSKIGGVVDLFNQVEIVYYKKDTRTLQLITQAELVNYYKKIKSDIDTFKYVSATLELINDLVHENEPNHLLYKGLVRILDLFENSGQNPKLLFIKFFLFLIKELGYELNFHECTICGNNFDEDNGFFDLNYGFICNSCYIQKDLVPKISKELFKNLLCLISRNNEIQITDYNLDLIIVFLQRYLKRNIPEFSGIKSLQIF